MLHASIVAASCARTTITRLADLLLAVETGNLGLVIHNVQVCDLDGCARVGWSSSLITAVVEDASWRWSDVKEKLAINFINTVLHTRVVTAPSTSTTITRLADLLISVEAGRLGLIVNNIQTMFSHSGSSCGNNTWRTGRTCGNTSNLYCSSRVSRCSVIFAAVVQNASRRWSNVKNEVALIFIDAVLHASIVTAASILTTIARLADLLIPIGAGFLGLVVDHLLNRCESSPWSIFTFQFNSGTRVSRSSCLVAAVVKDASRRRSDVKEKLAIILVKTMLHASIVAASCARTTITRLADLLLAVETGNLGLVIHNVQVCDLDGCARVGWSSSLITAVVEDASWRWSDVKEKLAINFINTVLHARVVTAPSTSTAIARLADLLITVEACLLGLIVNNIETLFSHSGSLRWNNTWRIWWACSRTQDLYSSSRVSRSPGVFATAV